MNTELTSIETLRKINSTRQLDMQLDINMFSDAECQDVTETVTESLYHKFQFLLKVYTAALYEKDIAKKANESEQIKWLPQLNVKTRTTIVAMIINPRSMATTMCFKLTSINGRITLYIKRGKINGR